MSTEQGPANTRIYYALAAYGVLVVLSIVLLTGLARYAVLILLGGLALKTIIAHKAGWGPD